MSPENSDSDDSIYAPPKQRAAIVHQPPRPTYRAWRDRYRHRIEVRTEPLERPFDNISEAISSRLDKAQKARDSPKAILDMLERIAHDLWSKKKRDTLNPDLDNDEEGSDRGGDYSPDVLECTRRIILLESKLRRAIDTGSGSEDSGLEDEPVPVVGYKRRKQGEKQGNVLWQCRNHMAYLYLGSGCVPSR